MYTQRFSGYSLATSTKTFQEEPLCVCVCEVYYVVYVFVLVLHVTVHVVLRGKLAEVSFLHV